MRNTKRLTVMIIITVILVCAAWLCISGTVYSQENNAEICRNRFVKEE